MKKLIWIFLPFVLAACEGIGPKKTKYISELTPKLTVESEEPIIVSSELKANVFATDLTKQKTYILTKNRIIAPPAFAKGVLYFIDDKGKVTAFSKKEKKPLWTQEISHTTHDHNHLGGGIVYSNEKLYVTNGSRFLIILDSNTGYEIMRKEFPDIIRIKPVLLTDNVVIIQTVSNQMFAYDIAASKFVWQHEGMFETLTSSLYVKPILHDSNVLVNYSSGQIFSFNTKNWQEEWALNLSQSGDISLPSFEAVILSSQPIVEADYIYLPSSTGKILKVALQSGEIVWEAKASDVMSMTLNGNNLFITNNAKQVAAISTSTGKVKWVGSLEVIKEKQKSKALALLAPVISKTEQGFAVSVIAGNGEIYNFFSLDDKTLPLQATQIKGLKNTQFMGATCCGDTYLINDKNIMFVE